jgi:hypothetical protein
MATVIVAHFDTDQACADFLLRACSPRLVTLGDLGGGDSELPPPMAIPAFPGQMFPPGTVFHAPNTPLNPPLAERAAAHDMHSLSGAEQDREAEDAAVRGEAVVPPPVSIPPTAPNPAMDLNAMPRVPQTPPNFPHTFPFPVNTPLPPSEGAAGRGEDAPNNPPQANDW